MFSLEVQLVLCAETAMGFNMGLVFFLCALYGWSALAAFPIDFMCGCFAICKLHNASINGVISIQQEVSF